LDNQDVAGVAFKIISRAAEARDKVHEALDLLGQGSTKGARDKLNEARKALRRAHDVHVELVQGEAAGEAVPVTLLLVHAEDVLMAVSSETGLAGKIIDVLAGMKEAGPSR